MIVSFYNSSVSPEVVKWQKKVFDKFNIPLEQIHYDNGSKGATGHGNAIDEFINERWNDNALSIFDIDCIPLTNEQIFSGSDILYGAAQHASHIPNSLDYISPAFINFTRKYFDLLGRPSFKPTERGDTGAEVTYAAYDRSMVVHPIYPTHVEKPEWKLDSGDMFGQGTTYNHYIYHAFNSRWNSGMFIKKCIQVCNG